MRLIIRLIDRAPQELSKAPLVAFIGRLGGKIRPLSFYLLRSTLLAQAVGGWYYLMTDGHVHRNVRDQDACLKKSAIHTSVKQIKAPHSLYSLRSAHTNTNKRSLSIVVGDWKLLRSFTYEHTSQRLKMIMCEPIKATCARINEQLLWLLMYLLLYVNAFNIIMNL